MYAILFVAPLYLIPGGPIEADKARLIEWAALPVVPLAIIGLLKLPEIVGWILALLTATWVVSTILSMGAATSFLGGELRGRGLLLYLACITWFGVAVRFRRLAGRANDPRAYLLAASIGLLPALGWLLERLGRFPLYSSQPTNLGSTLGLSSFLRDWLVVCAVLALTCVLPRRLLLGLLVVAGLAFYVQTTLFRWQSILYREHMWRSVVPGAMLSPIVGYGPDTGKLVVDLYGHDAVAEPDMTQDRTENMLIDALIERGIPGAAAELLFWGSILWLGRKSTVIPALGTGLLLAQVSVISVPSLLLLHVLAGFAVADSQLRAPQWTIFIPMLREDGVAPRLKQYQLSDRR